MAVAKNIKTIAPSAVLDKFTKEQLYEKWQEEKAKNRDLIEKYEVSIRLWNKEREDLNVALDQMKAIQTYKSTDIEILKKILKLRAENKSPVDIHYRLELLGVNIELEEIEIFLTNDLPEDLQEYFDKCKTDWLEKIRMNSKEYRYSVLEELQIQLDKFKKYQEYCGDPEIAHSVGKDIMALVEKIGKVAKDLDDIAPINKEKDRADEVVNTLLEKSNKVVKLQVDESDITNNIENIVLDSDFIN